MDSDLSESDFVPLDRLIMCCQPLYDARISEMRNEIEELKIKLFWAQNTTEKLEKLVNEHRELVNCSCTECHFAARMNNTEETYISCVWQPIFEGIAKECGLTIAPGGPFRFDHQLVTTMDVDAHLCSGIGGDWGSYVGIGTKFRTKSWDEIQKYEAFFTRIEKEIKDREIEEWGRQGEDIDLQ